MKKKYCRAFLILSLTLLGLSPALTAFAQAIQPTSNLAQTDLETESSWWGDLPKEKKMLYTNAFAVSFITLYGFADWDYGSGNFHFANEGWFERDTKYGGSDKLGHFWSTYVLADTFTALYNHWGYEPKKAGLYGVLSSWGVQTIMELDDGTSETQGFDWNDMAMNTLGAVASMFLAQYPELDRKIDFRVEYAFNGPVQGLFDDYSNMYYAVVVNLDGFDVLQDSWLQWLELHAGYCTRGYETTEDEKERRTYLGISLNLSRLLHQHNYHKTGKVLEYLQIPYTVPKIFAKAG
ncbi:MAG: DUF2279 domain-containing protein [Candidatus Electrothrix scaldis]|nr:MAG: DUF2279 domain-containing protein [Candidatus Electrothrix sp. GW3-3]